MYKFVPIKLSRLLCIPLLFIKVPCENNKDKAIAALQQAVYTLNEEDGRCRFVVKRFGEEVYSWEYQPTFRKDLEKKEGKKVEVKEEESKYDF